ncbi:MAG: thioredoxin [Spirochaetia bacterium]|jgi:thioredoxin 1
MADEVTVTRSNFDAEVMKSAVPVIADFWAEWCGPCKMIAPVLKDLARDYKDKIKIAKIDVDAEGELAQQFNIVSIPTILVFSKGQVVKQQIGAVPRPALEKMIKEVI